MKARKVLALVLSLVLIIGMTPVVAFAAPADAFHDIEGHWAEAAINRWSDYGIVEGYDGAFDPNGELTRAQLAAIIARLLNLPASTTGTFTDVDGHWAEEVINQCAEAGIMLGSAGKARPDDKVSREETMVMLGRALGIEPAGEEVISHYPDAQNVSSWAKGYVAALTEKEIVNGIGGKLQPSTEINRASTVTILNRAIDAYANESGQSVEASGTGIVLVAAENVTVTGTADAVVVAQGAAGGKTTIEDAKVKEVTVTGGETEVVLSGKTEADSVKVAGTATEAKVEVTETAKVDTVKTEAEKTEVAVSGTVSKVEVSDTAANTKVEAAAGSTITNVDNKAEGTTVAGDGKVENVTTSGNNTTVETGGTKVEAAEGTTGTTAGGNKVESGSTSTTAPTTPSTPATPSTGGSTGGSSKPSHSHTWGAWVSNEDGTHTRTKCHSAGTETADCTFVEGVCTECRTVINTAEELIAAMQAGGTITVELAGNVNFTTAQCINITSGTVTLNLNGYDIHAADDAIIVNSGATLTINGDGEVSAGESNAYTACAVWANGGDVTINGGTYNCGGDSGAADRTHQNDCIYAKGATITINGGVFNSKKSEIIWPLNAKDNNGNIIVKGGTFYGQNPEDTKSEPQNPNSFVAPGYAATEEHAGVWTVNASEGIFKVSDTEYEIYGKDGLIEFANRVNNGTESFAGKTVKLMTDINLENENWTPIGYSLEYAFTGIFNGNEKAISNLTITSGNFTGLFGYVSDAAIKNITLEGAKISGGARVGALAGQIVGNATISNCSVDATSNITGSGSVTGGLIGEIINGTVQCTNLVNNAPVENTKSSYSRAGGIVGQVTTNANVTIKDCKNNNTVKTSNGYAGGIVSAYQSGTLTLNNCLNKGSLVGAYKGNMLGWYTTVRSITILTDENKFDVNAIGCVDITISSDMYLYGKHYFVNRKADLTGVSDTNQTFSEIFAENEIGTSPKELWDKLIAFYAHAAEANSNFAGYPKDYWGMFNQAVGYSEPDWNSYFNDYNAGCKEDNMKLTKKDFSSASWREKVVYLAPES